MSRETLYADVVAHADGAIVEAMADFRGEIARATTVDRVLALRRLLGHLIDGLCEVQGYASVRADELCEGRD